MAKNIKQVYDANPSTTVSANDLLYLGLSPYGLTNDSAIKYSDFFTLFALSFLQTTGSVTAGDIPIYGANGQIVKSSTANIDSKQNATGFKSVAVTQDPTTALQLTTKQYVDAQVGGTNYQPNVIYSGNFDINPFQAGTSFSAAATNSIIADGWKWYKTNGTGVVTAGQKAIAPSFALSGRYLTNSMGITVTTADTSITSNKFYHIQHVVEGIDWTQVYQQSMTLSFWVYATVTGVHCVSIANSATTRCYVAEYTVSVSNTWQFVVINIPADSTGTWLVTPGSIGAYINFANAIGSTGQTAAGWSNTFGYSTSNQVNDMGTIGNIFAVDLVYLQSGTISNPVYPLEIYSTVLAKCQRFYQMSYDIGTAIGSVTQLGMSNMNSNYSTGSASFGIHTSLRTTMAIDPTIQTYDLAGTAGKVYCGGNGITPTVDSIGTNAFRVLAGNTSAAGISYMWTANAYLF